jgi:hypothetical protein
MKRIRSSTLLLSVGIAALALAVVDLRRPQAERNREVILLKDAARRQGQYHLSPDEPCRRLDAS